MLDLFGAVRDRAPNVDLGDVRLGRSKGAADWPFTGLFAALAIGFLAGALLMLLFDPDRGTGRRAVLRDRFAGAARRGSRRAGGRLKDVSNRVEALPAAARSGLDRGPVDDSILEARVREALGREIAHVGTIEVSATDGFVTLGGQLDSGEAERAMDVVRGVRGVRDVRSAVRSAVGSGSATGA